MATYVIAAGALTWPLAASLATHLPFTSDVCQFDPHQSIWALAWQTHALVGDPAHVVRANIYHPTPDGLFYGQLGTGALPVFAPAFLATGDPIVAANLTLLLGIAFTAWGLHLVARHWTRSDAAGAVAGGVFLTNQWVLYTFLPTAPHWAALFYFPWIIRIAAGAPRGWMLVWLGILVVLQSLTDVVYVAPAVLAGVAALVLARLGRASSRAAAGRLLVVLVGSTLALAPVVQGYMQVRAANPALHRQTNWAFAERIFPLPLVDRIFGMGVPFVITPVIGVVLALGAAMAVWRLVRGNGTVSRLAGHAALWAVVGGLLALPPRVIVGGRVMRLPQAYAAAAVPALTAIRVPNRLGAAGLMGLALLCGLAVASLGRGRGRRAPIVRGLAAAVVLAALHREQLRARYPESTGLHRPYPLHLAPQVPDAFLPALRSSPGPLLELPLGPKLVGPRQHGRAMVHSIAHWRPILNGYGSFWPADFVERMTLAARLPDPVALDALVRDTGLEMVWVHLGDLKRRDQRVWAAALLRPGRLRLAASVPGELLFVVAPADAAVSGHGTERPFSDAATRGRVTARSWRRRPWSCS